MREINWQTLLIERQEFTVDEFDEALLAFKNLVASNYYTELWLVKWPFDDGYYIERTDPRFIIGGKGRIFKIFKRKKDGNTIRNYLRKQDRPKKESY